jgi:outer membrane cobalamin receptor
VVVVAVLLLLSDVLRVQETIVVTAERLEQSRREATAAITVLREEDLRRLPAQNLGEALHSIPGLQLIAVIPGAPPMISSRGFFGAGEVEYMQLLVDGVPAGDVESGLADWRAIPIESIDRIEVLRGSGSSLFGDTALGGVVQVFRNRGSYAAAGGGSFGSMRLTAAYAGNSIHYGQSNGFREHSSSREVFAHAAMQRGPVDISVDGSDRWREDPGPLGSEPLFRFDEEASRRLRARVRHRGAVEITAHAQGRWSDTIRTLLVAPTLADRAAREIETTTLGVAALKENEIGANARFVAGADAARETIDSTYFAHDTTRGDELARGSGSRLRGAAFVSAEWRATSRLRFAVGARYDHVGDHFEAVDVDASAFSPRAGLSFDLGALVVYAQVSRAFKTPTLDQRFDQRPLLGAFTISNPLLLPQRAKNIEAGLRGTFWEATAYQTDVEDEIDFDVRTFRYGNIGRSRHRGFEGTAGNSSARLTYTWTRVEPAGGEHRGRQLKNIAEHVLRADFNFRLGADVHVAAEHAAGRFLDDANRFPLDDATVVDVKVARGVTPTLTLALEGHNIFDDQYAPLGFALDDALFYYPAQPRTLSLVLTWRPPP